VHIVRAVHLAAGFDGGVRCHRLADEFLHALLASDPALERFQHDVVPRPPGLPGEPRDARLKVAR
jgi:hypothetical protein